MSTGLKKFSVGQVCTLVLDQIQLWLIKHTRTQSSPLALDRVCSYLNTYLVTLSVATSFDFNEGYLLTD